MFMADVYMLTPILLVPLDFLETSSSDSTACSALACSCS
jgi:hypothetical protein